jgi:hypothetical protein
MYYYHSVTRRLLRRPPEAYDLAMTQKGDQQVAPTIFGHKILCPYGRVGAGAPTYPYALRHQLREKNPGRGALVYACQYPSCDVIISLAVDFAEGGLS